MRFTCIKFYALVSVLYIFKVCSLVVEHPAHNGKAASSILAKPNF